MSAADSISSHFTSVPFLFLQKDPTEQSELQYDEFGFRVDAEGKLLSAVWFLKLRKCGGIAS